MKHLTPMWILLLVCAAVFFYQQDIAFASVKAWDRFSHFFVNFNPVPSQIEDALILAGSCAFFLARTKELRQHTLMHVNNRNLLLSASTGIALGLLLNMDE